MPNGEAGIGAPARGVLDLFHRAPTPRSGLRHDPLGMQADSRERPARSGRNPATTDVQHDCGKRAAAWTALQRPATPAGASVDVRNETEKDDHTGGDSRERPAIWVGPMAWARLDYSVVYSRRDKVGFESPLTHHFPISFITGGRCLRKHTRRHTGMQQVRILLRPPAVCGKHRKPLCRPLFSNS